MLSPLLVVACLLADGKIVRQDDWSAYFNRQPFDGPSLVVLGYVEVPSGLWAAELVPAKVDKPDLKELRLEVKYTLDKKGTGTTAVQVKKVLYITKEPKPYEHVFIKLEGGKWLKLKIGSVH